MEPGIYLFRFERLEVWQLARSLSVDIYRKTRSFPAEEKYGLVAQIRRAAISVASNLAEGTTRSSARDQAHFTTMAYGSLIELFSQLIIASDLSFITTDELALFRQKVQMLSVKLTNLKAAQLKNVNS